MKTLTRIWNEKALRPVPELRLVIAHDHGGSCAGINIVHVENFDAVKT